VVALWGWLVFPFAINSRLEIDGHDMSPLLRHFVLEEIYSPQIIQALLFGNVAANMQKRKAVPKTLVYVYENQPWEKILLLSFRRDLPNTKLIGVQHAPFSDRYLSIFPSKRQWQDGTAPDILLTIGDEFLNQLISKGAPPDRVAIGGSLRMPHLANTTKYAPNKSSNQIKQILVSCPMEKTQAIELSTKAIYATQDIKGVEVLINFHPSSGSRLIADVKNMVSGLAQNTHVKFIVESAAQGLEKSDLLLYNSSGTVFDAASKGVPALYVGPLNGLNFDKLPKKGEANCRTIKELNAAIIKLLNHPESAKELVEKEFKDLNACFSKPDRHMWHQLLDETPSTILE